MGEMMRDQMVGKLPDKTVFETQAQDAGAYQKNAVGRSKTPWNADLRVKLAPSRRICCLRSYLFNSNFDVFSHLRQLGNRIHIPCGARFGCGDFQLALRHAFTIVDIKLIQTQYDFFIFLTGDGS